MKLARKQKIIIPLIIIVLALLGWQFYNSMGERMVPTTRPTANSQPHSNTFAEAAAPIISKEDNARSKIFSQNDTEYLRLLNQYQLLQVQRRIAEDTRAIAIAKLDTAKAVAETAKYTGSNNLGTSAIASLGADRDYKLMFTGQADGQWIATLKKNEQLMDVIAGTRLPDGYTVVSVESDAVTLKRGDKQKVISFLGITESQVQKKAEEVVSLPSVASKKTQLSPTSIKSAASEELTQLEAQKAKNDLTDAFFNKLKSDKNQPMKTEAETKPEPVSEAKQLLEVPAVSQTDKANTVEVQKPTALSDEAAPAENFYTIQLLADRHECAIKAFIKRYHLEGKVEYYPTIIKGRQWYTLVYGHYPSYRAARSALKALPQELLEWEPFVRKVSK